MGEEEADLSIILFWHDFFGCCTGVVAMLSLSLLHNFIQGSKVQSLSASSNPVFAHGG